MNKPSLLLIASLFLLVSVLYVRAIPVIEVNNSLPSNITTNITLFLFANFSDTGVGFNSTISCEFCAAKVCDEALEWPSSNVTTIYSADYMSGNCSYIWNTSNYNDDIYEIRFRIKDITNNFNATYTKITLDRNAPIFKYSNPFDNVGFNVDNTNASINTSKEIAFRYLIEDISSIANCSLILNNKVNKTSYSVWRLNTPCGCDGYPTFKTNISTFFEGVQYHNWSVSCTDIYGFERVTETKTFTLIVVGNFSGHTTDFTTVNLSYIDNLTLEEVSYGMIKFSDIVNLSGVSNINKYVKISDNRIEINSTALPVLNKSATIYIYNLTYNNTPEILRNNASCPDTICTLVNYSNGTLIFNVTQFSTYTAQETDPPIIELNNSVPSNNITTNITSLLFANFSDSGVGFNSSTSCELCLITIGTCDTQWTSSNVITTYSSDYLSGNCSYVWNVSNYIDGLYSVNMRIKDIANNIGQYFKNIMVDRNAPTFSYLYPYDNSAFKVTHTDPTNITNSSIELTFSYIIDDTSSIANCSLIFNNKINNTNISVQKIKYYPNKFNLNIPKEISTTQYYNWSIRCSDILGFKRESGTRKFTLIMIGNFSGETTDLATVNLSNIENLTFEQVDSGKIKFADFVNLSGVSDVNKYVKIYYNKIEINSSALSALNKSATLYIYNLTYNTTPKILKDGIECPDTICKIVNYSVCGMP